MSNDLAAFLRHHIGEDLRVAQSCGGLALGDSARKRLVLVDEHEDEGMHSVILRALADRYGGYRMDWRT